MKQTVICSGILGCGDTKCIHHKLHQKNFFSFMNCDESTRCVANKLVVCRELPWGWLLIEKVKK